MANIRVVDEGRESEKERREYRLGNSEQHRKHGADLVAAKKEERKRISSARSSVISARDEQGSAVKLREIYDAVQRKTVEEATAWPSEQARRSLARGLEPRR